KRPVILAILRGNGKIIDAGNTPLHQPVLGEFPILVAVAPKPAAAVVMPLIGEAHGNTAVAEGPQLLDQTIIELAVPLARKEGNDLIAAAQEFRAIPPHAVLSISERDGLGLPRVPGILCLAHLLGRCLKAERRKRWAFLAHDFTRCS